MKRIFVTGAGGFVGARACRFLQGNYEVLTLPKGWMASCTELQLMQSIAEAQPDVILHTAAISDTGYTEQHPEEAYRANGELPRWLARAAAQCGARLVGFSSDQVYAGVQQPGSLPETMELSPANVYGRQKLEMEQRMLDACPDTVLLRATWMYDLPSYGLPIRGNLPLNLLRAAQRGENREDMVTTALAFAEALRLPDADNLIEAVDWQRNLAMDCGKLRGYGIRFDTTQEGIYHCLNDYGVADL